MKKTIFALAIASLASSSLAFDASALDREGQNYLKMAIGFGYATPKRQITGGLSTNIKGAGKGTIMSFGVGHYLLDEFAVGMELMYSGELKSKTRSTSYSSFDSNSQTALFGVANYDLQGAGKFSPFFTGGFGMVNTKIKEQLYSTIGTGNVKVSRTKFGILFGLGTAYHWTQSIDLELSAKAFGPFSYGRCKKSANGIKAGYMSADYAGISPQTTFSTKPSLTYVTSLGLRFTF